MIRCAVSRGSSSAKLLTATGRAHISTTKPPALDDLEREHGISEPSHTPQLVEPNTEKCDVRTTAADSKHGTQQSTSATKPVKRRELPISPYMDPKTISAKEKYHAPKRRPSKSPTAFQKLLAKNPYALALATPVRICRFTSVALPRYFLQDFNLMEHPETKEPWWVPRSLARKHPHIRSGNKPAGDEKHISTAKGATNNDMLNDLEADAINLDKPKTTIHSSAENPQPSSSTAGPCSYVLARKPLLKQLSNKALAKGQILESSFSPQLRERGILHKILQNTKIRPDIDTLALELMRRRAVEGLEYLVERRVYIRPSVSWKDATLPSRQAGAILWTGSIPGEPGQFDVEKGPLEFATVEVGTSRKHKVPVHNLEMLLGETHLQRLKEKSDLFEKKLLIIRHKNLTVDIQMNLWKLQGFLAEYRELLGLGSPPQTNNRPLFNEGEETHQEIT